MKILRYLETHEHGASSRELDRMFPQTDARKRISELRRAGYEIKDRQGSFIDEDGKAHYFKIYYMEAK